MSYEMQENVLPSGWAALGNVGVLPPGAYRVSGLGLARPVGPTRSGTVPAYPRILPTLDYFLTTRPQSRARLLPSISPLPRAFGPSAYIAPSARIAPTLPAGVVMLPPSASPVAQTSAGPITAVPKTCPPGQAYHPTIQACMPAAFSRLRGLADYQEVPLPELLYGAAGYNGAGLYGLGCPGCGPGMGQLPFGLDLPTLAMYAVGAGVAYWFLTRRVARPIRHRLARGRRRRAAITAAGEQLQAAEAMPGFF